MTIEDRLGVVKLAEVDCEAAVVRARDTWTKLGGTFKTAATPWRIVTVGAVTGFLMGRTRANGQSSIGSSLFASVAQALVTAMSASAASGVAASAAAEAAANASATATSNALQQDAANTDANG
ncbi:MAG: hypothetical protein H7147_00445 [Frankiaceae bacterium]|nr:hypothetical protein [Arenimonas sp.]